MKAAEVPLETEAAAKGAAYNVRINVVAMPDAKAGKSMGEEAQRLVKTASTAAARATAAVETQLG